ncbi:MAG: bifunctional folylpolyglutamate synthase/dihydrofolate synthase [Alphaproteobacteria bacterium]
MALHPKRIDLSLGRVERLLAALGHPERRLPPVVHVSGTNGKGSVIAFLRAFLEAAGCTVHAYTSPHLVRFHERICLAGRLIDEDDLGALLEECEAANAGRPITFFEITTAAAFLAFCRRPADILLLETGLGGRLDATNVVAKPLMTAITPVSLDHAQYLGHGLKAIAREKAGILKPGVPAVVGRQPAAAARVIAERAREVGVLLVRWGSRFDCRARPGGIRYRGDGRALALPPPALLGPHQVDNAGLAIACALGLPGFKVEPAHLARGLRAVDWPGRLQRLTYGPLLALAPKGCEIWVDGGHNPGAGAAVAAALQCWGGPPLYLVVGMLNTKDPAGFIRPLAKLATEVICVPIPDVEASLSAAELKAAVMRAGVEAGEAPDVATALERLRRRAAGPARVLITGSLYLVGAVLRENA